MLPIPVLEHVVVIQKDMDFRCRDRVVYSKVIELLNEGKRFVGTTALQTIKDDSIPYLIISVGPEPAFFKEGGFYLKDNPLPHHITPILVNAHIVYQVDIL